MGYVHAKRPGAVDIANQAADAKAATTKAAAAKQMAGTGYAEQAAALAPEQAVQAKAAAGAKGAKGA
ncbi:MAG: hypothetical protein KC635_13775, partial [Myxococcales bacterium]|nr:hypothetical protein [Myxococcales bacterium]